MQQQNFPALELGLGIGLVLGRSPDVGLVLELGLELGLALELGLELGLVLGLNGQASSSRWR